MLLQNVAVPTAAAMTPDAILTQLITHSPQTAVIIIHAGAAVVCVDHISRWTSTGSSIRRRVTVMFTAQRSTAPDTAVASGGDVGLIFSIRTVNCPVTEVVKRDADTRRRTRPFAWITLLLDIIAAFLVRIVLAVILSITQPDLMDAAAAGTGEVSASAGWIGAVLFITSVSAIVIMIADVASRNTLSITALKLTTAAPLGAVGLI